MKYSYVTIEGNIGVGKTTLATMLANHFNAKLILEQFADNPFLPKFYEDQSQYALPLELFFMAERYKQMQSLAGTKDMFQQITVSDYLFTKCLLFSKVNLQDEEFRLYQRIYDIMCSQFPQPEILVYLHAPVQKLQENIRKRNRPYEQSISDDYLFSLQETYTNYIKQHHITTLFVDASNADFIDNPKHFETILAALDKEYEAGQHYLMLP